MRKLRMMVLVMAFLVLAAPGWSLDFEIPTGLPNQLFGELIKEAGALSVYRPMLSAEPSGWLGFDVGVAASAVEVDSDLWALFLQGESENYLGVPRLQVSKGLPLNLDVGLMYGEVVDYDIKMWGAELQYAFLDGSAATPAVAIRGSYTNLDAASQMEVTTFAVDGVISKGFLMFTPYGGVGAVFIDGEYTGSNAILQSTLTSHSSDQFRFFAGLQTSIALLRITAEYEYMDQSILSAKISLGF